MAGNEGVEDADSPIFVVGCPRSGTSLLRNLLRSHPRLTLPDESHFIPGVYRRYGDPADEVEARQFASLVLGNMWVKRWELSLSPDDFADCRSFRGIVSRLFGAWAQKEGKPRWGDKTPHYLGTMPVLLELFPKARILHIHRDGRDVALSWLRLKLEPRNVYMAARMWRERVSAGMRTGRSLPRGSYMEVSYEALLRDTEGVMRRVCEFVGEPFCEEVLKPTQVPFGKMFGKRPYSPSANVAQPFVVDGNIERWRTRMSRGDRMLFESVAGDLLGELGYPVVGPCRAVPPPERAFWTLHHQILYVAVRVTSPAFADRLKSFLQLRLAGQRFRS